MQLLTQKRCRRKQEEGRTDPGSAVPVQRLPPGLQSLGEKAACEEHLKTTALSGAKDPPGKFPHLSTVTESCAKSRARSLYPQLEIVRKNSPSEPALQRGKQLLTHAENMPSPLQRHRACLNHQRKEF